MYCVISDSAKEEATMTNRTNRLLLRACPRCHGDLFPDREDDEFLACLQCGRRMLESQLVTNVATAPQPQFATAA
jgi:hypothetical protein